MSRELERIRRTYRSYAGDAERQARWDPAAPGNRAMVAERWRVMAQLLRRRGVTSLSGWRVLEVGCGGGGNVAALERLGLGSGDFAGVDLMAERVAAARRARPKTGFAVADGAALPFPSETFDAVLLATVLSSVLEPSLSDAISADAVRVLRPGGLILWYDMRVGNPRNRNVVGIGRRRLTELFPGMSFVLRSATVLPPLTRALGPATSLLYPVLGMAPVLRTHWVAVLRKRDEPELIRGPGRP